jgi:probable HAF family extracellular repeat protein
VVRGLNNRGQVVGEIDFHGHRGRAAVWRAGRWLPLGAHPGFAESAAAGINDSGSVVGQFDTFWNGAWMGQRTRAFLWRPGRMALLPCLPGFPDSSAAAVNNRGDVVGRCDHLSELGQQALPAHAFLYHASVIDDLGEGQAAAINSADEIVGSVQATLSWQENGTGRGYVAFGTTRAILWKSGQRKDLGYGRLVSVNDRGWFVGTRQIDSGPPAVTTTQYFPTFQPYLAKSSTITPLDFEPACINNQGQVVGVRSGESIHLLAVLWKDGRSCNLESLIPARAGWRLKTAVAINDRGQIIGAGQRHGQARAFLLTPRG